MIGDKMSDILAAQRAGCKRTILVKTGITDGRFTEVSSDSLTDGMPVILNVKPPDAS